MAVRNEAFLSIDVALANQLEREWDKEASRLSDRILSAFEEGDRGKMLEIANEASMEQFAKRMRAKFRTFGIAAAVFGAKTLSKDQPTSLSGVKKANEPPFDTVNKAVDASLDAAEATMGVTGSEALRESLTSVVSESPVNLEDMGDLERVQFRNKVFNKAVGTGRGHSIMASGLHTSRLSVWGFTQEAEVRGITTYQITEVLDSRTCPVCEYMHGKTFSVESAQLKIEQELSAADDPASLKALDSWPPQRGSGFDNFLSMGRGDMVANGWNTPPFHPGCRGILNEVGSVTDGSDFEEDIASGAGAPEVDVEARKKAIEATHFRTTDDILESSWARHEKTKTRDGFGGFVSTEFIKKTLREDEHAAIAGYTGGANMNWFLRNDPGKVPEGLDKEFNLAIDSAKSGLAKMPKYQGTTYRWMDLGSSEAAEKFVKGYVPGSVVKENAFFSTSRAEGFADDQIAFVVKSKTGVPVEDISTRPLEQEVLFAPGSEFKVLSVENPESGRWVVYLEDVTDA